MKTTHLNDLFDGMEKEEGNKLDDKIDVEEDEAIIEISELYDESVKKFLTFPIKQGLFDWLNSEFEKHAQKFTSEDINKYFAYQQIKTDLEQDIFQSENQGIFLSVLINNSKDEEITLDIIRQKLSFREIGFKLKDKKLNLRGVKNFLMPSEVLSGKYNITGSVITTPYRVNECKINIEGDVRVASLHSRSEEVYIRGNVESAGPRMDGGKLIIDGNVTKSIGYFSKGGQIHLNGEIQTIYDPEIVKSKIFHNGKLIHANGKPTNNLTRPIYILAHKAKELLTK